MIRVGIIDDHKIVHFAMQGILKNEEEISIVAGAYSGREGLQLLRNVMVDVVLLDLELPDITGLQVADRLRKYYPNVGIIMLTAGQHLFFVEHLLKLGIRGYVTKSSHPSDLIMAIEKVADDQFWFSQDIISQLSLARFQRNFPQKLMTLTTLEKEVMMKLVRGYDFNSIAEILCVSKKTIYDYGERLFRKLNVKNKVELTLLAIRFGVIDVDRFR